MTPFEGTSIRLAGVQLQELHVRLASPGVSIVAKVALVTDATEPVAVSVFSALSPETIAKISEATRRIEQDFVRFMALRDPEPTEEEGEQSDDFNVRGFPSR